MFSFSIKYEIGRIELSKSAELEKKIKNI